MRRLPPQKIDKSLQDLIELVPDLCEDLLSSVDQPLKIAKDSKTGKDYLLGDYNRDGDSYRSPWSNSYEPPLEDGSLPSDRVRALEIEANKAFEVYREMYYDGGVSSVYLWDLDSGFAGAVLIKKAGELKSATGCWDSIHVIEVEEKSNGRTARYKLTSTIMLWLETQDGETGCFNLGGSLTRMTEKEVQMSDANNHIVNIGRLVEDMENSIRKQLNDVYFGTSKNLIDSLRSGLSKNVEDQQRKLCQDVKIAIQNKHQANAT